VAIILPATVCAQPGKTLPPAVPQSSVPDPLAPLPKLAPDQARIFFFRKPQFTGMVADARIAMDGTISGWVGGGSAVFIDHPAGKVVVSIGGGGGFLFQPKPLSFEMTVEPGKEYFVGLAAEAIAPMGGALSYLMVSALNANIPQQYCGGGWCAGLFDKSSALPTLAKLSVSGPNPNAD
jgi:hypothetical protein